MFAAGFSYLVVSALHANFWARKLRNMLFIGWSIAALGSVLGLYCSLTFNWPTGAG